jgi:dCTP diphosphatase
MMSDTSLAELQTIIRKFCDDRNWDQFHNPKDLSISLSLEAAELLEHFQWKTEAEIKDYLVSHKPEVAEELADVFYWVLLVANKLDVDLVEVFQKKMKKNELKYPTDKATNNHKKHSEISSEKLF